MKEKKKTNLNHGVPFTRLILEQLEKQGYKYLQIKGYTHDNQIDHIQPHYIMLIPFKEFPKNPSDIEIYEPINSNILSSWAEGEIGARVIVSHDKRVGL